MQEAHRLALRAFAEAVVPTDDTVGAADVDAAAFVEHYLEVADPGTAELLAAALDVVADGTFADLDVVRRLDAIADLSRGDARVAAVADLAYRLVVAAFYGEWTGQDETGALASMPVGWELSGYPGPVAAAPSLLPPSR